MRLPLLLWTGLLGLVLEANRAEPCGLRPSREPPGLASGAGAPAGGLAADSRPAGSGRFAIPEEPQRPGDPKAGYDTLVNAGYVSCGVPWSIYRMAFGDAPASRRLPGRRGHNARLSYDVTALKTSRGVEVVTANCLGCHATPTEDGVIIGLGNSALDLTEDFSTLRHGRRPAGEERRRAGRVVALVRAYPRRQPLHAAGHDRGQPRGQPGGGALGAPGSGHARLVRRAAPRRCPLKSPCPRTSPPGGCCERSTPCSTPASAGGTTRG